MKILVNGEPYQLVADTLAAALVELGYGDAQLATAVNENFVPSAARATHPLAEGDRLEILAPRQGG